MTVVTLADTATGMEPSIERGVVKTLVEETPIARVVPFKEITGPAYQWHQEQTLPSVGTRAIGGSYTSSKGSHIPKMRDLKIMGGSVEIDQFILATQGTQMAEPEKVKQYRLWAVAMSRSLDNFFFNGDDDTNPNDPRGLKKIIAEELASTQNIMQVTGGGQLTLAKFHQAVDTTVGAPGTLHAFMNRKLWRKLGDLIDAQTGAQRIEVGKDKFNMPSFSYQGVQLHIMERKEDGTTVLDFNEDPGDSTSDTASLYILSLNEDNGVHGITAGGMLTPKMTDYGIIIPPNHLGFGEWYYNFVVKHPRAATRLYGILEPA